MVVLAPYAPAAIAAGRWQRGAAFGRKERASTISATEMRREWGSNGTESSIGFAKPASRPGRGSQL
jgi:hypothetical protein